MDGRVSHLKIQFCQMRLQKNSPPKFSPPPPQEISWYSFLLEAEWTAGLLSAERRNRSPEDFQGPYLKSNPESPVLRRNAQPGG